MRSRSCPWFVAFAPLAGAFTFAALVGACREPAGKSSAAPTSAPSAPSGVPALASAASEDDASGAGTISPISAAPAASTSGLQPRNDLAGLRNFAKVSDVLYRGAQPTQEGFRTLKAMGVKTVINLRAAHSDRDKLAGTGLNYVHIRAKAWHPETEDVLKALRVILDPANQPVFVHCQHGADRTGMIIASYRMVEQGWKREEAAKELPNFHFHPVWTEITGYLASFDREEVKKRLEKLDAVSVETVD
jgi:protein tyrosine/serine phosphatase